MGTLTTVKDNIESQITLLDGYIDDVKSIGPEFIQNDHTVLEYLAKAKSTASTTSTSSSSSAADESDKNSTVGKSLTKSIQKQAASQFVQTMYDLYMAPEGLTDINYRLGKVSGSLQNLSSSGLPTTDNVFMDSVGRLQTNVNSIYTFTPSKVINGSVTSYKDNYVNFFFPPFTSSAYPNTSSSAMTLAEYIAAKSAATLKESSYFDTATMLSSRGSYTYRDPGFKAVNDYISFLQWLLERTTGIVSTYLTEWDLSLYIQESLLSASTNNPKLIELCYRIEKDNPLGYTGNKAYTFGVVNAALQKLHSTNRKTWDPSAYPYSQYWTAYTDKTIVNTGLNGVDETQSIKKRVLAADYENAALAGWSDWSLPFYKTLYSTYKDSLSDADTASLNLSLGLHRKSTIINNIVNEADNYTDGEEDSSATSSSEKNINGYSRSGDSDDTFMGVSTSATDNVNAVGIPQTNPVLYGGPHGADYSPKALQSYNDSNSTLLRDYPRLSGTKDFDSENSAQYFSGNEKYFSQMAYTGATAPQPYEHSFSEGVMHLEHGLTNYKVIHKTANVKCVHYFYGTFTDTDPSNTAPSWPTTYNGQTIIWDDGYSSEGKWTGDWAWNTKIASSNGTGDLATDIETLLTSTDYDSYMNNTSRVWETDGNVYVSTYCPMRKGYTYESRTIFFKRYFAHSEPTVHWQINKIRMCDSQIGVSLNSGARNWWNNMWSKVFYTSSGMTVAFSNIHEEYKLTCVNSPVKRKIEFTSLSGTETKQTLLHTQLDDEVINRMVDAGHDTGEGAYIVFCQKNTNNGQDALYGSGPDNIFRCKCSHKVYSFAAYQKVLSGRKLTFSNWHFHWSNSYTNKLQLIHDDYISVDLNDCDLFFANTSSNGYANFINNSSDTWNATPTEDFRTYVKSPLDLLTSYQYWTPYYYKSKMEYSSVGMQGFGLYGCVQSLGSYVVDTDGESYSDYIVMSGKNLKSKALIDLPYKAYKISDFSEDPTYTNGLRFENPDGIPTYSDTSYSMPLGTKKGFMRAFTTGTFYKGAQYSAGNFKSYYRVDISSAIRMAYDDVSYQNYYLNIAKELFTGTTGKVKNFDFDAVKKILSGAISPRTYALGDPDNTSSTDPENSEAMIDNSKLYGYNQWIREARVWFDNDSSTNNTKQNNLKILFNNRMGIYSQAAKILDGTLGKYGYLLSITQIERAVEVAYSTSDSSNDIEKFFLAYLNVLYEYRRILIDKRFNKEDGTMWMIKQVESTTPLIVSKTLGDSNDVENTVSNLASGEYQVSFYDLQNSNTEKATAAINETTLSADRIKTLYIPVEYATEAEYTAEQAEIAEDSTIEQTIVKVRKWLWKKSSTGLYAVNAAGDKIKEYADTYKYAYLPVDGRYRLESKEFLDNEALIAANEAAAEAGTTDENEVVPDDEIDEAIWSIEWADDTNKTPIVFDVCDTVDVMKAKDLLTSGITNVSELLCGSKTTNDYWSVTVKGIRPRAHGFKTCVKIKLYDEDPQAALKTALAGPNTYHIYPITEEQVNTSVGLSDVTTDSLSSLG